MYPVALALLGAAGAWLAWRRNPLYSAASTLRLLGVVVLSVAALMLVIMAGVDLTNHRSAPVMLTTLLTVVILGTLAMIYIIQVASIPKAAQLTTVLPPSAKLLNLHRLKVYVWAKALALLLGVCAVLGSLSPGAAKYVIFSCGALVFLLTAILLPVMYLSALKYDRSLTALEYDPWVHWRYSPEQWKQWTDAQLARMRATPPALILKRELRRLSWMFAMLVAGVLIFSRGSLVERIVYAIACCCGIFLAVAVSSLFDHRAPDRIHADLVKSAAEAYFGADGLFCEGAYTLWLGLNVYLMSACIDERPPRSLLFKFEKIVLNPYGPNQVVSLERHVLVPEGGESDLARLQRELKIRCPKARIALV